MENQTVEKRAVIVPASAGSGKTYRIAHEYIYDVLRDRYDDEGKPYFDRNFYKRILAVTFTNKATEEMKSRILKEIHTLASGEKSAHLKDLIEETQLDEKTLRQRARIIRSQILHDYSHFTVLTNDTFFQRILRAFVRELHIDMNFSTELDTVPLLTRSIDEVINDITSNEQLRNWLEGLVSERIDEGSSWNIRKAIATLNGELFKESTKDIIKMCDKDSLKQTIQSFRITVNQMHDTFLKMGESACKKITSRNYTHSNFLRSFTRVFENIANDTFTGMPPTTIGHMTDTPIEWFAKGKGTSDLLALAKELQGDLIDIYNFSLEFKTLENTLNILNSNYRSFALLHDLQNKIEEICREDNSMLLSETKHAIAGFISESEAPFIYEKVGNYFDKFMIDEFQDTSSKEWNNFLPLLRNAMAQSDDTSVLIVGDVKQSIYRWRGGDWRILGNKAPNELVGSFVDPLKFNWRSLPNIVAFNTDLYDSVIDSANSSINGQLNEADRANRISKECKEELYDALLNAYKTHKQDARREHKHKGYISIVAPKEGNTERYTIGKSGMPLYIERIREVLEKGFLPRDITILVHKHDIGTEVAEDLLKYVNQFPEELRFDVTTEEALKLSSSPAVKLIIAIIRLAINRDDTTSLALYNHIYNNDSFGTKLNDEDNAFLDSIRMMSPEEAFEHIAIRYGDALQNQSAYVMALHENIVSFSAGKVADLQLFEKWWCEKEKKLSVRVERSDRSIEILTVHKSKGLENKVIIVPYCAWRIETRANSSIVWTTPAPNKHLKDIGAFPVWYKKDVGESLFADGYFREKIYSFIDAINMLYVATTRAKEQLHLFIPPRNSKIKSTGDILVDKYGGLMQETDSHRYYELGSFDGPDPTDEEKSGIETSIIKEHHTSPVSLKLRTSASRYFADEEGALSPRSIGILLHRAFEGATTREEIFDKLEEMVLNGELRSDDVEQLKQQVSDTLDNTIAGEWFDGSWSELHRERNIIRPKSSAKRPDRVMTRGSEAVVVDYKFGEENPDYKKQIEGYIRELEAMGYTSVKGYIWYVPQGKIV